MIVDSYADIQKHSNEKAFDVCVVGAGPAGITVAMELARAGKSVALVESGGFDREKRVQRLYRMDVSGLPYRPEIARLRYFGGASNHWAGWAREIDAVEFSNSVTRTNERWPIAYSDIDAYYVKAAEICDINPDRLDTQQWLSHLPSELTSGIDVLDTESIGTGIWQYSLPTRFGEKYKSFITDHPNIALVLGANLANAEFDSDSVERMNFKTLSGDSFYIKASQYVVCGGGLENARILLTLSNGGDVPGNRGGNVGRYFSDHTIFHNVAEIISTQGAFDLYSDEHNTDILRADGAAHRIRGFFHLRPAVLKKYGIRNIIARLEPPITLTEDEIAANSVLNYARLYDAHKRRQPPRTLQAMPLVFLFDQTPSPDSRVTLLPNKVDALGLPVASLNWRVTESDKQILDVFCNVLGAELSRLNLGRVRKIPFESFEHLVEDGAWVGYHHYATTRMAASEEEGVVDKNGKVFGTNNLFISGSSVFPSVTASTPTLSIVALALRLGEHLAEAT